MDTLMKINDPIVLALIADWLHLVYDGAGRRNGILF